MRAETIADKLPITFAIVVFSILSLHGAVTSKGFLEADACTHYLYARFAFDEPHYFVNVWGRPICTAVYSIPALLAGRLGARVMSLILALVCSLVAYRIAKNQGYRWPVLALIFTLAQPLVFLHSFSELTELPFAALIGLAFLAYQTRRFAIMTILIAMSPLSRPEGFGFIGLAFLALVAHRKWFLLPILITPLIAWNYAGWLMYGREGEHWKWLVNNWPYSPESLYAKKPIYLFLVSLPAIVGPFVFPATLIGIWRSFIERESGRRGEGEEMDCESPTLPLSPSLTLIQLLLAVIPILILIGHSIITATGKMASNGELRYMLVVAPLWGVLSAFGWEWIFKRFNWNSAVRWAGVAALLPGLANQAYRVLPLKLMPDWEQTHAIVDWYKTSGIKDKYPAVIWAHPGVSFYLDASQTQFGNGHEWTKSSLLTNKPTKTLVVWDSIYGIYNSDAKRSISFDDFVAGGWIAIGQTPRSNEKDQWWCLFASEPAADIPLPPGWIRPSK